MPIASTDIQIRLSGGAANPVGNAALGGVKSSNVASTALDGLFDQTAAAEAAAGDIEYRCIYIHNAYANSVANAKVYIGSNTPSPTTTIAIGLGTAAVNGTEQTIANEDTAPVGVTFSEPATQGAGIVVPTLPTGQHVALWLRRTINTATAATAGDAYQLAVYAEST